MSHASHAAEQLAHATMCVRKTPNTTRRHPPGSVMLFLRARSEMHVANMPQPLAGHSSQRCGRFLGEELPRPSPPATACAAAASATASSAAALDFAAAGDAAATAPTERLASGFTGEAAAARGDCTLSTCCLGGGGAAPCCCCCLGGAGGAPLFCRSTCGRTDGCPSGCVSCCMERCRLSVERSPDVLLDALRVVRSWSAGGWDGAVQGAGRLAACTAATAFGGQSAEARK